MDDPAALAREIKAARLDEWPREKVRDLFKAVDAKLDMIKVMGTASDHAAWTKPWNLMMDYIDPKCLIEYPFNDWQVIDDALGTTAPGQPELFS